MAQRVRRFGPMFSATHIGTSTVRRGALAMGLLLGGCDSADSADVPDLPSGWEGATLIEGFTQKACEGSPYDGPAAVVTTVGIPGAVSIDYEHAAFRCSQDVEGYVRRSDGAFDVLVQPVEMDPDSVAKCDCLYDIVMDIPAEARAYTVTLYQRGDNKSGQGLERVGSDMVRVPADE